jgi:hypothetical protein
LCKAAVLESKGRKYKLICIYYDCSSYSLVSRST